MKKVIIALFALSTIFSIATVEAYVRRTEVYTRRVSTPSTSITRKSMTAVYGINMIRKPIRYYSTTNYYGPYHGERAFATSYRSF